MEQEKAKKLEAKKWCQNCKFYKQPKCTKFNDWRPRKMTCTDHESKTGAK
jgi:hypothetical protein